ncbi:hypothetical protein BKD26_21690 [Streptomyces sp. CB03238]|nr:hypothetical protein BKD26_21690 [Streptomyces sp. CB03238]
MCRGRDVYSTAGDRCSASWSPTGLPWLNRAAPRARRAGAVVIAASMVGGVAAGPTLGKAIERSGIRAVPLLLCGVSALCLAATLWLIRSTRPR